MLGMSGDFDHDDFRVLVHRVPILLIMPELVGCLYRMY